jgi:hypothetical protein
VSASNCGCSAIRFSKYDAGITAIVISWPSAWRQLIFAARYGARSSACASAVAAYAGSAPATPRAAPWRRKSRRPGCGGSVSSGVRWLIGFLRGGAGSPVAWPASMYSITLNEVMPPAKPVPFPGRRSRAKDVARLAGVSTATVSRVLNTPEQVDDATERRVRDAVATLGYVPHGAARALRSRRSQMVGAVVPSFDYALYARTTSAMQGVLDPGGYAMVLAEHHYDLAVEVRITEQLVSHGVDAFVFVGLEHDPRLFTLLDAYA